MRSWVLSLLGIVCLLGTVSTAALGQDSAKVAVAGQATTATQAQKPAKEVKFKLDWISTTKGGDNKPDTVETESVTVCAVDGQASMSTNALTGSNTYRRIVVRPESQPDGSYLVSLSVSDFTKDQDRDVPRVESNFRVKMNETKVYQARHVKGTNYEYDFVYTITPTTE